ncbi:hypothetical protein BH09VER1_BH09VER1_18450 [soil metagenome]
MAAKVCILISTCERYRPLAAFTVERLRLFWRDHPPLFSCGLESTLSPGCSVLPLVGDPADWMAVTRAACADLLQRGFSHAYVILDDHPPLALCHARHLNHTLPAMAQALEAVSLSLSGYGQRRPRLGRSVRWRGWDLDRVSSTELWKFPLHPALWDLTALQGILDFLLAALPPSEHTPWAFERKGGDPSTPLPDKWKSSSYRINGARLAARPFFALRHLPLRLAQILSEGLIMISGLVAGPKLRDRTRARFRWLSCPYDGPYPLFWSGLMAKGKVNSHLVSYCHATGQAALLARVKALIGPA